MKHSIFSALRSLRHFWRHQQSGSTLVMAASVMSGVVAVAGLSVDVGRAYAAKRALSGQTQAAALAGAYALAQANATSGTVSTAVSNWTTANPVSGVTMTGTPTPTLSCVTSTSNLPTCSGTNPNVVSFTQSGTVPTYFLKAIGVSSLTVSSTASAAKAGGTVKPFNIMFVLDATGSMGETDSSCTVPGKTNPSRWQCALYSIQSILKVMPTSLDGAGLMIFPGMGSQYSPGANCSNNNQPSSVHYYTANIKYQIGTALDNTYNNGSGALNASSPMVRAVGIYATSSSTPPCVTNPGGQGSHAAEVITKAQALLAATTNNATNVIIFLSDGDYGASQTNLNNQSSKVANQCAQAVTAAQAATTAGTQVFSVAYGASTATSGNSSSCTTDTPTRISACTTMQTIASDSSKFYSTDSSCQISGSTNQVSQLPSVFQAISTTLTSQTKPRLLTQ
jgi:Flp pilus assembly protein TadG